MRPQEFQHRASDNGPVYAGRAQAHRRTLGRIAIHALALASLVAATGASALDLSSISNGDAASAVRVALQRGADAAVSQLGRPGGFLGNGKWEIPLPDPLRKTEKLLRFAGQGKQLDALKASMNRAAEAAVPQAKVLLAQAVKSMRVSDAKAILTGGPDSVTRFFRSKTENSLRDRFKPIVAKQVSTLGVARQYDALAGQGSSSD
ncbi:MAG: DUF4197 domain-containing protein [Burkholderiaceae bacterium]